MRNSEARVTNTVGHRAAEEPSTLHVLHTVSGLHVGGVGRMLLRNIAALESDRVRNHIAYLVPNDILTPQFRAAGFDPICLDHRRTAHGPRTLYRLIALIRELGVNLVHTNHTLDRLYGGLAAKFAGIPAITTAHDTLERPRVTGGPARRWLDRRLLSKYIAVSVAVARLHESARGVRSDRIHVIHSGIEYEEFAQPVTSDSMSRLKGQLGLHDAHPILINVARLSARKGQQHLIPMMSRVLLSWPRATLLLVGEGAGRPQLEAAIAEAGLQESIKLLGVRSDIRELLALSAIFVFPSESEGLPISVLEAMGAARPVVGTNIDPMAEVVAHGESGLLVPPGDPTALAGAVNQLLSCTELSNRMGQRGREIVAERFSIQSTTHAMDKLYRATLAHC